jgi:hypothetical protein
VSSKNEFSQGAVHTLICPSAMGALSTTLIEGAYALAKALPLKKRARSSYDKERRKEQGDNSSEDQGRSYTAVKHLWPSEALER